MLPGLYTPFYHWLLTTGGDCMID